MASLARIERALTSSGVNLTWGPVIVAAAWSTAVIYSLRIVDHLFPLKTAARSVFGGGAPLLCALVEPCVGQKCGGGRCTTPAPDR